MRAVVQRVSEAFVCVEGNEVGRINEGFLIYLGIGEEDTEADLDYLVKKVVGLRIFSDMENKMNLSIKDIKGELLVISQFTLYGDVRKGNRPSFTASAKALKGREHYEAFCARLKAEGFFVAQGQFQSDMQVYSVNNGPVTILLDSNKLF